MTLLPIALVLYLGFGHNTKSETAKFQTNGSSLPNVIVVPKISREEELEREVIRLSVMVVDLQSQVSDLRKQLVTINIRERVAAWIEKLSKNNPDFVVNPETLELTNKASP